MGDKTATPTAVKQLSRWIRSRSVRQQVSLASIAAFLVLIFLKIFVKNYTYFYIAAQLAHSSGILLLIYKLSITKTCSGLSLKTQELTAIFLTIRILSHFMLIRDIYIVLDSLTLLSTLWVIYMIRFKLKTTYLQELDNMPLYYVLVPAAVFALIGHPGFRVNFGLRFFYMYSKAIEAVSVLPQLQLIQNAKMVEPFTSHYVFALGVARFFACANWIIMLIDTKGAMLTQIGHGHLYILIALLAEVVQTFILADFCYYYVKSAQVAHSFGILLLIYKLSITKTCSGLSLKTQELTATFLIIRILCHFMLIRDIYILVDSLTLSTTLWVIYMIRFKLKTTYLQKLDNMPLYYVLLPAAIVALIGHPGFRINFSLRFFYMYSKTIEAVSVLPQLHLIQNAKMVEPFTAHYVFALGVARFFACANWIIKLIDTQGAMLTQIGHGHLYILIVILSDMVQTFILADFCYYYIKSIMDGQRMMRLPSLV